MVATVTCLQGCYSSIDGNSQFHCAIIAGVARAPKGHWSIFLFVWLAAGQMTAVQALYQQRAKTALLPRAVTVWPGCTGVNGGVMTPSAFCLAVCNLAGTCMVAGRAEAGCRGLRS